MKSIKSFVLLVALPLVAATSMATHAHDSKEGHDGSSCHKHDQVKLDADGDGKISQKEFMDSDAKRAEWKFTRMDKNKDGVIDAAEQKSWKEGMAKHRHEWKNREGKPAPKSEAEKSGA